MGVEVVGIVIAAIVGSKFLDSLVTRFFRKENDHAEADQTRAGTAEIMAKAAETTLAIMQSTIMSQDKRIQAQDERILRLEERVLQLHAELVTYKTIHGPLPESGSSIHITGDIMGVIE
jgi:polyhydroxyalkanoate synthesis regulator phasin